MMLKSALRMTAVLLLAACLPVAESVQEQITAPLTAPVVEAPASHTYFVEPDFELAWGGLPLTGNQYYVLRLWYEEEPPVEVWTLANHHETAPLIDPFSREVGRFFWQVAVVNTDQQGAFASMGSDWSEVQVLQRVRRIPLAAKPPEQMSDTARLIAEQPLDSALDKILFTRSWMYEHTVIEAELSGFEPDYSDAAQQMYDYAIGIGEAPVMYCNGISTTMLTVLQELGIESRLIFLYGEVPGWIAQHTFLEVFNPDRQLWEVHDAMTNLHFIDTESGERVSVDRMVFGSLDTIAACDSSGDCSANWDYVREMLGAFRYGYSPEIWVNPDRLNMSRRIEAYENTNFAEWLSQEIGYSQEQLIFHFISR